MPLLALSDALRRLKQGGWTIRFFCVWPNDLPVVRELAARTGISNPDIIVEYRDAARYIREVGYCRVFIGMKLHAAILAVCAGVATMALEYQPKHADYMSSINSESELVRIDRIEGESLANAITDTAESAREVSERQWESSRHLASTFRSYLSQLEDLMA